MATTLTTNLTEAMKIVFADPLVENIVTDSELLDLFQRDMDIPIQQGSDGRYIEMAHYYQLPAAVGARSENEYIPVPGNPKFANSRVNLKKLQGAIEMSGDTMKKVTGNPAAFIDYAARAMTDLNTRFVSELDRMYIGPGTGHIGRIAAGGVTGGPWASTSTIMTVAVDRAFGVSGLAPVWPQVLEGMTLIADDTASGASPRTMIATVVGVNEASDLLYCTFSADPTTWTAGDYLFAGDAAGSNVGSREITGLYGAIDDGNILATYHNITRTANDMRFWRGIVYDASSGTTVLTDSLLALVDDTAYVQGAAKVSVIVTSRAQLREYWKDLKTKNSYNDPRGQYVGGKGTVSVVLGDRTITLRAARKLPTSVVFGLDPSTFSRITLGTFEWDDTTGSVWNRVTDSTGRKDAFYAVGNYYEELICKHPRKNFRIDGLDVT